MTSPLSVPQAAVLALLGYAMVFFGIILLAIAVKLFATNIGSLVG